MWVRLQLHVHYNSLSTWKLKKKNQTSTQLKLDVQSLTVCTHPYGQSQVTFRNTQWENTLLFLVSDPCWPLLAEFSSIFIYLFCFCNKGQLMLLNWSLRGTSRCRRKQGNEQRCMTTGSLGKGGDCVETNVFFLQIFYLKYSRLHSTVYYQRGSVDLLKLTDALHMTHFFKNGKKMRRWLSSKCISNGNQGKNMTAGVMFCLLVCDSFFPLLHFWLRPFIQHIH